MPSLEVGGFVEAVVVDWVLVMSTDVWEAAKAVEATETVEATVSAEEAVNVEATVVTLVDVFPCVTTKKKKKKDVSKIVENFWLLIFMTK